MATLIGRSVWGFAGGGFRRQFTTAREHFAIVGGLVAVSAAGLGAVRFQLREHGS
ncbi:hypothetical protein [Sphingomonas sanxanigenens]|nr:hypothetical protein [Sphingomonas sanxanigenens]